MSYMAFYAGRQSTEKELQRRRPFPNPYLKEGHQVLEWNSITTYPPDRLRQRHPLKASTVQTWTSYQSVPSKDGSTSATEASSR